MIEFIAAFNYITFMNYMGIGIITVSINTPHVTLNYLRV